ncbi:MAG: adenine deaminase [Ramalina farinacea]|uniref:Adenine deaminase n=1 Tax=Ramalina farinacea TaxID=258253 RepID=A0AA43QJQ3_9LECA|nr:adenine deaminase [Ramalina farinacea]
MHLEGALSPSLLFTLASRNNIPLPSPQTDPSFTSTSTLLERYDQFTSLDDFLHYYFIGMSCLVVAQDFEDLAWEYFKTARSQNVMHAEVFFDPQAHTARGIKYETVVEGFGKACRRAETELGMSTRMILCFLRHLPVEDAKATWEHTLGDFENGTLAGIGLDSSEKGFPPEEWRDIYADAKVRGIQRTAHAGEEGPVEYIKQALRVCDVQRIDHGIKLADDEELMKEVAERKILVTMCPLSNLKLQCVQKVDQLPVRKFLDHRVQFSINSDDPAYFTSYIQDNYCAVQDAFDLQADDWSYIGKAAVVGSWIDEPRKAQLLQMIDRAINDHHGQ